MDLTIHLYGYGYYMFNTLNAIAMLRNSTLYPAIINTMALAVGVFYAWQMAASRAEGQWRQYLMKVLGMAFLINALLLPKASMNIKDHVEKHFWRVDNIPLAFALPIGMVEEVGHLITIGFEQAFSAVAGRSAFNYYHHGTVFGARLSKEVLQVHVRNPEFISNMKGFIERCVIVPAMLGEQFTKEELVATKDMWGLVSKNAGTFTRVPMIINKIRQVPSPTCKQAVPYFEQKMALSGAGDITDISIRLRAPGPNSKYNPKHLDMNNALKGQIEALYNNESKVADILKHNMMINALNNYRAAKYPAVKAQLQHEAGGFLSGDLADKMLTASLTIMKNLVYGSSVFIFPMMLLAGGMGKYRLWITFCLSLQLWPPLFAMLNMMIDTAYEPAHIVSYSSWSTAVKQMDSIASMAAHLTLLIPLLAIWVTRMGEGGFLHLAGSIMATSQSASASAAAEQASGGMSYDNTSIANRNRSNVNENKYDDSMQFVSGINSGINMDGSMEKILPNGQVITVAGAGTTSSAGESTYHETEGISTALHEGKRQEIQAMHSTAANLSKAKESLISKEASALATIAQNTRTDNGYNIDTSADEGKEVVKGLNAIDRMTEGNEYSWQQNAEAYLKSDITLGGKIAKFFGADVGGGGKIAAGNNSSQSDTISSEIFNENNIHDRASTGTRTSEHSAWLESHGVDKNQQESIRESGNETTRLEENMSAHKDRVDAYSRAQDHVETNNAEFSKDMTQDVVDAYKKNYNVSDRAAAKAVFDGGSDAQRMFRQISSSRANEVLQQVRSVGNNLNNSNPVSEFMNENQNAVNTKIGSKGGAVDSFAKEQGMIPKDQIDANIRSTQNDLATKHIQKTTNASNAYQDASNVNTAKQQERQQGIDQLEEDRIGKGKVSKLIGGAANVAALGNAGWGIGRPDRAKASPETTPTNAPVKAVKPNIEQSDFNSDEARGLIESFKPDTGSSDIAKGDGQYVDPTKKVKG